MSEKPRPRIEVTTVDAVVSVLVGLNFAVASPLLDLLGANPDVFTVRESPPTDVGGVLILLTLGMPITVGLVTATAYAIRRQFGVVLHSLLLATLLTLFIAQLLDRLTPLARWPAAALFALAAAVSLPPILAYFRNRELRRLVRFGVIAPLGLAAVFIFFTPTGSLLAPVKAAPVEEETQRTVANPVPVIMLMLDALPVIDIMDAEQGIDEKRFPSFARLAEDATWFRNAATDHAATRTALPSIMTGIHASEELSPNARNFPNTVFATLAEHYRTIAFEPYTALCHPSHCARVERVPTAQERWTELSRDVGLLGLHAVLPASLDDRLPPAEQAIGEFAGAAEPVDWTDDQLAEAEAWRHFLEELRPDGRPGLHFFHWLKPHYPWTSLPSGKEIFPPPEEPHSNYTAHEWRDDWQRTAQWQRHLMQAGYSDILLGQLLDALQAQGIYDDALVIVASDHGEAFTVGEPIRRPSDRNLGEIAFAALFVKTPGQQGGTIVDDPVELVDIVPTIYDVLDVAPMPKTDGRSLLGPRPEQRTREISGWDYRGSVSSNGQERAAPLARKVELFGSEGGWDRLFRVGRFGDVVGTPVSELRIEDDSPAHVRLQMAPRWRHVDLSKRRVPTVITGTIHGDGALASLTHVAIVLNGRVAAVVEPYQKEDDTAQLLAVVSEDALADGDNGLEFYEVREAHGAPALKRMAVR